MTPWARTQDGFFRWLVWRSAWVLVRLTLAPVLRIRVAGRDRIPPRGGAMLLANHTTFWDFMICFWGAYRPARGIGSEQVFRLPVAGWLIETLGGIPFSKGAKDGEAIRKLVAAYEEGGLIGMFPEGERSWTGHPVGIKRGTGRLIKSLGCPVVYCRVTTGHLQHPRWATWPRMVPWRMEYSGPEHFADDATEDEINQALARGLAIDPEQISLPDRSWGFRLAEGLPDFLWACPVCFAVEALRVQADRDCVGCTACERLWRLDLLGAMAGETPDTPDLSVASAHALLVSHFPASEPIVCGALTVSRIQRGQLRKTPVVTGAARLTDTGLQVARTDGEDWVLPYDEMRAVLLQFRNKLQVRVEGANLQLEPAGQSTLRWHHFLQLRVRERRQVV